MSPRPHDLEYAIKIKLIVTPGLHNVQVLLELVGFCDFSLDTCELQCICMEKWSWLPSD
jgi:hypothetical protein